MSENLSKKKILLSVIVIFLISLLVEIFVFNMRFFQTALYDEVPFSEANSMRIENAHLDESGNIELDEGTGELIVVVDDIDMPLKNIRLDVEIVDEDVSIWYEDHICDVEVYVWDESLHEVLNDDAEGGTLLENDMYRSTSKKVSHDITSSQYLWLETYGTVKSAQFRISSVSGVGRVFRINNIVFNANAPLGFSFIRFIVVYVILMTVYLVFFNSRIWNTDCLTKARWKAVLPAVLLVMIAVPAYIWPSLNPYVSHPLQDEYGPLARALLSGNTSVGDASEIVKEAEGKIVFWNSYSNDVMFDYSYYDGRYYVYFGVLPCIVFYMPYYIITGSDLPNYIPFVTLCLILVAEIYLFLGMLIRRFYRSTPYPARLLMTGAAFSGMYLPLFISVPDHYTIAICFGVVLFLAGGMCWLRAAFPLEEHNGQPVKYLALGSVLMAAVSLCRPTLLIPGFVLIGLMTAKAIKTGKDKNSKNDNNDNNGNLVKGCLTGALAIAIPYMVFGVICMYYNQIRFGSPFDFGVSKNITSIPFNGNGGNLFFQFVRSIYEYFFAPAVFTPEFPFLTYQTWRQIAEGSSIMAVTKPEIGLFSGAPVLWGGLLCLLYKNKIKEKGIWKLLVSLMVCALLLMLFSTRFTSCITDRYTLEFSLVFFTWAFVGVMELNEDMRKNTEVRIHGAVFLIVKAVFIITLFFGLLQLLPGKGLYNLSDGDTELYYRIFYAMNFML